MDVLDGIYSVVVMMRILFPHRWRFSMEVWVLWRDKVGSSRGPAIIAFIVCL